MEDTQFIESDILEANDHCGHCNSDGGSRKLRRLRFVATTLSALAIVGVCTLPWVRNRGELLASNRATSGALETVSAVETKAFGNGFCGITANPHLCPETTQFLAGMKVAGAENILCKSNMMQSDCELSTERRDWVRKDPSLCKSAPHVLFLWDMAGAMNADPTGIPDLSDPLCGGLNLPGCPQWAAKAWIDYVDKWRPKIMSARNAGLRISSPSFNGDVFPQFTQFFEACPQCSQAGSPYYIDVLSFKTWMSSGDDMAATVSAIRDQATRLKAAYSNRPVILSSVGIGAGDAAGDAKVLTDSGLFQRAGNPLDAIYWSVYPNAAFSAPDARTCLTDLVLNGPHLGKFLGKVLLEQCGPER